MKGFATFMTEAALNTHGADVNEIQMGHFVSGENWGKFANAKEAQDQLEAKRKIIGDDEFNRQTELAKKMADEVIRWSKKAGYTGIVKKVWWTARPGVLSAAVGHPVDNRLNPTDILIQFSDGDFLGLSAKSTKQKGDIGFKNPGLGTIERDLKIDLKHYAENALADFKKKFPDMPASKKDLKPWIRAAADRKAYATELGIKALSNMRDDLLKKYNSMGEADVREHLLTDWLNAHEQFPIYVKVTGNKNGATVEDPFANSKLEAISTNQITFQSVGDVSIGVMAGKKKIMKIRFKYESEKLATSIKLSGEPW